MMKKKWMKKMNSETTRIYTLIDGPSKSEIAENNRYRIDGDCPKIRLLACVDGRYVSAEYIVDREKLELRFSGIV